MSDTEAVLLAGIRSALDDQAPRALGIRSHAVSTEEHVAALVAALTQIAKDYPIYAVIGRPGGRADVPANPGIEVLGTHAAAARATSLRNNDELGVRRLVYFNTESTPGEAGLDGLDELTPQALARGYALTADLQTLKKLASDQRRQIVDRIEDATVSQLADYAEASERYDSEMYALPLLGLLPGKLSDTTKVASLFQFSGPTLAAQLTRATKHLSALSGGEKARIESALQVGEYVGPYHLNTLNDVVALSKTLTRFARGLLDTDLKQLCGLNTKLLRLLRAGDHITERLSGSVDPRPIDPVDPQIARGISEARLVERDGFRVLDAPEVDLRSDLSEVVLKPSSDGHDEVYIRAPRSADFALAAASGSWGEKALPGCALRISNHEALLRGIPLEATVEYELSTRAVGTLPDALQRAIADFREQRRCLVADIESTFLPFVEEDQGDGEANFGLGLLECFPLLVVRRLTAPCRKYVNHYASLVACVSEGDQQVSQEVENWLLHLDVAFAYSSEQQVVSAARLLPLHPLRVARYLAWIDSEVCPPAIPANIAVTYRSTENLRPSAQDHCYHRENTVGPNDQGVALAAKAGLEQLWGLLSHERLVSSLAVELCDIANPVEAVQSLANTGLDLFESDRCVGNWLTLTIHIAFSEEGRHVDVREVQDHLGPEFDTILTTPPGEGFRLELRSAGAPDAEFRHLVVQGIETPYRNLPADDIGTAAAAFEVYYVPSSSGAIGHIEVRGDAGVDAYRGLLEHLNCSVRQTREPGIADPVRGNTLMRTLVCQGGWPIRPEARTADLLAYGRHDDDVYVTLADSGAVKDIVKRQLQELRVPESLVEEEFSELQSGILALYPFRDYLMNLVHRKDDRHLRGGRGVLKAFKVAKDSLRGGASALVLSLDTQEGLQWAKAAGVALDRSATRADLLIIEADANLSVLERIRIAELKSSESAATLEAKLTSFAKQPLATRDGLLRVLGRDVATTRERATLRRLIWLGAGHQNLAQKWELVLRDIDERVRRGAAVEILAECWLVPDGDWPGEREFDRDVTWPIDGSDATSVAVHYTVIAPPPETARQGPVDASQPRPREGAPSINGEAPESRTAGQVVPPEDEPEEADGTEDSGPPTRGIEVRIGRDSSDRHVHWYPNDTELVTHFNVGVTGTMGTGKTQLVKSLVAQIISGSGDNVGQQRPGLLVFDYKGDYGSDSADGFANAIGARILVSEHLPLNPLHLVQPTKKTDFALQSREFVDTLVSIDRRIGAVQRDELIRGIQACLADAGVDPQLPETWERPFPTLVNLLETLRQQNLGRGTPQAILGDLVDLEIFAPTDPGPVAEDLLNDVTVIDLRHLAGAPNVIKIVISCFMNAFYASMIRLGEAPLEERDVDGRPVSLRGLRRFLLVDEADDFMSLNLQSLKNTMQQGRSFGCGVILSTQFLKHFEGADAPLRQLIGTWIMHRMAEVKPREVEALLGVSSTEAKDLTKKLARLPKHKAIALGVTAGQHERQVLFIDGLPFYQLKAKSH